MPKLRISRSEVDFFVNKMIAQGYVLSFQTGVKVLTKGKKIICVKETRNGWVTIT